VFILKVVAGLGCLYVFILKRVRGEFLDVFIAEDLGAILGAKWAAFGADSVEVFIPGDLTTDFLRVRRDERCLAGCHDCRRRDSQRITYYLMRVNKGAVWVVGDFDAQAVSHGC
jgi:hypothetical protein